MTALPTLSRRTFLRGVGATLALPWLEAMTPRSSAAAPAAAPAKRFAFIYTPNGYYQPTFLPTKTGMEWELTPALEPLAPVKRDVTLVTGLDRVFAPGTGVHAQCGSCWLTSSAPLETLDGGFPTNTTLDQILARQIGQDTMLPSLELSCNDFADNKETKYFECISWYGPGYAANTEKNPRAVFQRLFGSTGSDLRKSILDVVSGDAKSLYSQLSYDDQQKLSEYLDSVRATEKRIQFAEHSRQKFAAPPMPEPKGIPELREDYLHVMAELFVLAFQQDQTRVATLVVDPERWDSPRMFHGVFDKPQNHHVLTHSKAPDSKTLLTQIDRFHVKFFAHVLGRLKSLREGDGTLLDHTILTMGSGISDGDKHDYANLEVLMAGGGLRRGHFHYEGTRPLADLWLTLAHLAGVKRDRLADSTGIIPELLA